jgi:hypothetical protein
MWSSRSAVNSGHLVGTAERDDYNLGDTYSSPVLNVSDYGEFRPKPGLRRPHPILLARPPLGK